MAEFTIVIHPQLCTGCLRCALVCSHRFHKVFEPSKAQIRVRFGGTDAYLTFSEECIKCGTCADECLYGALEKLLPEEERP
jgi:NAD-dependent dihydropyrimidine dehydrogenase PreA subunit